MSKIMELFLNTRSLMLKKLRQISRLCWISLCGAIFTVPNLAFAQDENSAAKEIAAYCKEMKAEGDCIREACIKDGKNLCLEQYHFTPYQPNSAVLQSSQGDDVSIEVNYSFRYLLSQPDCTDGNEELCKDYDNRWEHFLSYTGKFDFYAGTRPSGPVVNRVSNPAWHSRRYVTNWAIDWFDIGVEHKSNGQVASANEPVSGLTQYKSTVEFNAGNHQYIDSISRGTNYVSFEVKKEMKEGKCEKCELYFKLYSLHWSEESDVYWGKYAGQGIQLSDFERVKSIFLIPFGEDLPGDMKREFAVEWTVGDKGLATDSASIWLKYPFKVCEMTLPLTVRTHFGPMSELSNYSESQRSIGIGLAFFH